MLYNKHGTALPNVRTVMYRQTRAQIGRNELGSWPGCKWYGGSSTTFRI